jgi:hypothetical protein
VPASSEEALGDAGGSSGASANGRRLSDISGAAESTNTRRSRLQTMRDGWRTPWRKIGVWNWNCALGVLAWMGLDLTCDAMHLLLRDSDATRFWVPALPVALRLCPACRAGAGASLASGVRASCGVACASVSVRAAPPRRAP